MPEYGKGLSKPQKAKSNSSDAGLLNNRSNIRIDKNIKVSTKDLLVFFRQLAVILKSGVPLAQGIELLSENTKDKKFSVLLFRISNRLKSGDVLSECLKDYPRLFPAISIGLIEAGEAGGILDKVLERIAKLPTKDEAYSMLMGLMKAPIEKTVRLLNEIPTKFVRLSNAMKDKQEEVS